VLYGLRHGRQGRVPRAFENLRGRTFGTERSPNVLQYGPVRAEPNRRTSSVLSRSLLVPAFSAQPHPFCRCTIPRRLVARACLIRSRDDHQRGPLAMTRLLVSGQIALTGRSITSYPSTYNLHDAFGGRTPWRPARQTRPPCAVVSVWSQRGNRWRDPALRRQARSSAQGPHQVLIRRTVPAYSDSSVRRRRADIGSTAPTCPVGSWPTQAAGRCRAARCFRPLAHLPSMGEAKTHAPAQTLEASYCAQPGVASWQLSGRPSSASTGLLRAALTHPSARCRSFE